MQYQIIWETPTGQMPDAGIYDDRWLAGDHAGRSVTELVAPSTVFKIVPIEWPNMWRKNQLTGQVEYDRPSPIVIKHL